MFERKLLTYGKNILLNRSYPLNANYDLLQITEKLRHLAVISEIGETLSWRGGKTREKQGS
jgi:hypothetical protein